MDSILSSFQPEQDYPLSLQEILLPTSSILRENKVMMSIMMSLYVMSCHFVALTFLSVLFRLGIRYINFFFASVLAFAYQGNFFFFFASNSSLNDRVSLSMI